jgi:pyruvate,water dikinase
MKEQEAIDKIKSLHWKKWLQRPFTPLILSFFAEGFTEKFLAKIGIPNIKKSASLFQNDFWYESKEVWESSRKQLEAYLKDHTMIDVTNTLDEFYEKNKKIIKDFVEQEDDPIEQFKVVYEILTLCTSFIWLTHGFEEVYKERLNKEVPKYVKEDINKFIGDASFPKKKNKHVLMDEAIRRGDDPKKIAEEFGWIRCRSDFTEPFTAEDIEKLAKELEPPKKIKKVSIPKELQSLFDEIQELVYFRTARTDVFYELLFLARPIFKRVAKFYKIPFSEFPRYIAQSLISGKLHKLGKNYILAQYEEHYYLGEEPIIKDEKIEKADFVKGRVAFQGVARGTVKIIRNVSELSKVEKGDILVTQMTFPSYIMAMHKAAAFVTDEGGITCHAAIVAREMQKPCIVGTEKATKIFKDGDLVEVDANKGVVKKL